jgi:hypothetical protein
MHHLAHKWHGGAKGCNSFWRGRLKFGVEGDCVSSNAKISHLKALHGWIKVRKLSGEQDGYSLSCAPFKGKFLFAQSSGKQ